VIVHWDDAEPIAIAGGELRGTRMRLGAAAGSTRVGLSRYLLGPGERAMPVHVHGDEEELFYVLAGAGLSWQDGRTYAVGPGDCILHLPGAEAHTIVAAGEGLDVLAFGSGSDTGVTWLPRARAWWLAPRWLPAGGPDPFAAEAAAGPLRLPAPEVRRPATIVALGDARAGSTRRGDVAATRRDLGRAVGSVRIGVAHITVEPGMLSAPPHCHSAEEELFVVLDGDGALLLGDDEHALRAGSVVARPPGTGVAHAFRAGAGGLALLAFGTRAANDMAYYPRSRKVALRGLKIRFHVDAVGYWDGEPGD
jgi:uncharacterized cupin superfamily protein